jgi:hypothetical protein
MDELPAQCDVVESIDRPSAALVAMDRVSQTIGTLIHAPDINAPRRPYNLQSVFDKGENVRELPRDTVENYIETYPVLHERTTPFRGRTSWQYANVRG